MGYHTKFNLKIANCPSTYIEEEIISELRDINECAKYAIDEFGDTEEESKWYDHEQDLKEFSLQYPEFIFVLEGIGEAHDDMWIKYFKNGKCQVCDAIITFDPFDESELK